MKTSQSKNLSHITSNRTRFKSEAKLISGSVAERFKAAVLKTAVGCTPKMGKKQRVAFEKCSKFIDEGLEMKFGLTTILAAVILLSVTACGQLDRELASMTGSASKTCIDGVTYLQFTNGATVQVDQTGKPVACK
mgnify:FL=1